MHTLYNMYKQLEDTYSTTEQNILLTHRPKSVLWSKVNVYKSYNKTYLQVPFTNLKLLHSRLDNVFYCTCSVHLNESKSSLDIYLYQCEMFNVTLTLQSTSSPSGDCPITFRRWSHHLQVIFSISPSVWSCLISHTPLIMNSLLQLSTLVRIQSCGNDNGISGTKCWPHSVVYTERRRKEAWSIWEALS